MHGDWRLRRAAKADAGVIAVIFTSSRRAAMPYLPVLYTELEVLHWIKNVVLGNSCVIVAVSDDGQPGGFATCSRQLLAQSGHSQPHHHKATTGRKSAECPLSDPRTAIFCAIIVGWGDYL
jgi:hypothetical protein